MPHTVDTATEWLEADGLGGFSSGTTSGILTRRYHALLLTATTPPTGRMVLVNGMDVWVETPAGRFALSSQEYAPGVVHPDGAQRIQRFEADPWPRWFYRLEDGTTLECELFVPHGMPAVVLRWRLTSRHPDVMLSVRPFLSGRDYHSLHHENSAFRFDPEEQAGWLVWRPYPGAPAISVLSNGTYRHEPDWFRQFLYREEMARGLDGTEDLASPGFFQWPLSEREAVWIARAESATDPSRFTAATPETTYAELREREVTRRNCFPSRLHRAADAYLVRRQQGMTILAGYPWFTDWGRDTFIALRGLCLATGLLEDARAILLGWADAVSEGMLPNRFPDGGESPEYNSVDASLWYIVAVYEFLREANRKAGWLPERDHRRLESAAQAILAGYAEGTRYGIRLDSDGLLSAGEPGVQLTWMDAKVGDWVVTPRIGKPVEIQALWLNALWIASGFAEGAERWKRLFVKGRDAFLPRFWDEERGSLCDVADPDHRPGEADWQFRPNQIFAVGGLPVPLLQGERARRLVEAVESKLWTPLGLRSLAPGEPGYVTRYEGGVWERDGAYHQGTVWPWLAGPFVEAWVRVRGGTKAAKEEARARFVAPLLAHLDAAGLGHMSEIADAVAPHIPRGCPFQAWSVGELLRLCLVVLSDDDSSSL
ncbi:MAG: glycogen debranching enzyme family protein [Nitrospirae bacterium]|nr:glycogen debranching enzyme family protein [Nitrospirota bacterium]